MNNTKLLFVVLLFMPALCAAQTVTENYVKTVTMLDAGGSGSVQAVQYYDGLGYPTLAVATAGGNGETAATLTTYDGMGREKRKYLPVPGNGLDYFSESGIMSKGGFNQDNAFFTQTHHDALGRVTAVDMAGDTWRQAGKQDRTEYLANTASDLVLHYEAPDDGSYSLTRPEKTSYTYYPEGTLSKAVSYDADGKCTAVFTDLFGNKILERTDAGDTYYVYNAVGQLRFVITPAYNKKSRTKAMFSYEYRYDKKGRMLKRILPKDTQKGSTTQFWYDRADRTAYMRDPALGSRYRFYLYDKYGRLCVQGTCSDCNRGESILSSTSYATGSGGFCMTGYAAPTYNITDPRLEIVNYYDNYDFLAGNVPSALPELNIGEDRKQYAFGFQTGQVVYATNGEPLVSVSIYDRKGQVVRTVRKSLGGHLEDVHTAYTFTGAVDSTEVQVGVGYGDTFTARTKYTYQYGKKTAMKLSVSQGGTAQERTMEYAYDAIGRLCTKRRQLSGTASSDCAYTYDVHGWLTGIDCGGFREHLYYADGLDGGCYNGNISTVKWAGSNETNCHGYNLKYDGCNRLYSAAFGTGDDLTGNKNYFDESAEYDCNGNITRLRRRGLTDNIHGGFGLVDDLYMTYMGNMLTGVRDEAERMPYTGATDFDGIKGQEYPLTYNDAGSLVSDAGRRIARIDYDCQNNPVRIQFTDGNVTKYIYSAAGEKLRVVYQTAVPNITVGIGSARELAPSEILYTDSTDYLLGGALTLKNGRTDMFLFDEGYCKAEDLGTGQDGFAYLSHDRTDFDQGQYSLLADGKSAPTSKDAGSPVAAYGGFTFYYYDRDHLGNIRQVTKADGTGEIVQRTDYYPFGARFCDGTNDKNVQPYRYNGKELDKMHGLNTYDYGARQYNPVTARWDRIDPLCEKYYPISPYVYCHNNPVNRIDPDGKADYFTTSGNFIRSDNNKADPYIYIQTNGGNIKLADYNFGSGNNNLKAMMRVVYHYAYETGLVNKAKSVGVDPNGTNTNTLAYTNEENRVRVFVSDGHFPESLSHAENFKSTLRHEEYHIGITNDTSEEVQVIMKEMEHPDFSNTTQSFKENTCGYLQMELVNLYKESPRGFNKYIDKAQNILNQYNAKSTFKYINGGNEITF